MYSYGGADKLRGNIGDLLRNAILNNNYYKTLATHSFEEVIDEVLEKVTCCEPWVIGANGVPSTLFCCLFKMVNLRLTEK